MAVSMNLLFGYDIQSFSFGGVPPERLFERVLDLARSAEAAGFDLVTVMDHFHQVLDIGLEEEPMLEAYTTLGAIAVATSRVQLGTLVSAVTHRNPSLLAKAVTTLDVISQGRAVLGIGAAWNEAEHRRYGYEFPSTAERIERLHEALAICKLMFTQDRPSFEGRHYRIDRALNQPRPLLSGGPQILIGGAGERRTLPLAARHADITHWSVSLEQLRHKVQVLEKHCKAVGRDSSEILVVVDAPVILVRQQSEAVQALERISPDRRSLVTPATPVEAVGVLHEWTAAGAQGFTFPNTWLSSQGEFGLATELISMMRDDWRAPLSR